ncbi:hypothetical protein BBJ28_00006436 [Nothophytophthora sp. Chile5]|nr:hypothetical protein BBJ28_00006436 [Nothophytophthora sp. Chile5]
MSEALRELRPLYKKMLKLAQSQPEPKRQEMISQIRREFRNHGDLSDPKACVRSVFPPIACWGAHRTLCLAPLLQDTGVTRYVYRDGKRVDAAMLEAAGEENARYKTQDIEGGLKRHHQLLRRQYFMDRKSGPPRPLF